MRRAGIACELSDAYNVLFLLSSADGVREIERIAAALEKIAARCGEADMPETAAPEMPPLPETPCTPRAAYFAPKERVSLAQAAGRTAAETILFYPPGIPVLAPGDAIQAASLDYLRAMRDAGARVVGASDASLETILVTAEG